MEITVHHAQMVEGPREPFWRLTIEVTHDDGRVEQLGHLMPVTAIEWRVAQFNCTPEAAVKMLLAEPYMDPGDHLIPDLQPTRRAARAAQADRMDEALSGGSVVFPDGKPPFVFGSTNSALVESGDASALTTIVANSPISSDHVEVKREFMDAQREEVRQAAQPAPSEPAWERESADDLRASLIPTLPERPTL